MEILSMGADTSGSEDSLPLSGLRVLDFTRHMAGPMATSLFADFGADVIKIEGLPKGDGSRTTGTVFYEGESGLFLMWNRGKRDLALDLRHEDARQILDRLIADADVLVENFRPGVAERMGIGYDHARQLNPRIIHTSVSAFGKGALASMPGTDPAVQAMSGVMAVTGVPDGDPLLVGIPIADFTGAMLAAQGTFLALLARHRTGKGQKVDVSMLFGLISALTTRLASYWGTGEDPVPNGNAHSVVAPYQAYPTSDGYIMAGVWDSGWRQFCGAIGKPELEGDPRFPTNTQRVARRNELNEILYPIFRSRTTREWSELFREADVLHSPVKKFSEILNDPAVLEAGILTTVKHDLLGDVPQVGPVIFLSETPGRIAGPPPVLGAHSVEVLSEAGFGGEEIDRFLSKKAVLQAQKPERQEDLMELHNAGR